MEDDTLGRMERYLNWQSNMVAAASYLSSAIHGLAQAEFALAGLKTYPALNDNKLRMELRDHEDRMTEIRDMLIHMQIDLRKDIYKDFTKSADKTEGEE